MYFYFERECAHAPSPRAAQGKDCALSDPVPALSPPWPCLGPAMPFPSSAESMIFHLLSPILKPENSLRKLTKIHLKEINGMSHCPIETIECSLTFRSGKGEERVRVRVRVRVAV